MQLHAGVARAVRTVVDNRRPGTRRRPECDDEARLRRRRADPSRTRSGAPSPRCRRAGERHARRADGRHSFASPARRSCTRCAASSACASRSSEESNHDPLTGLPNRRFFAEWLSCAIAHARRQAHACRRAVHRRQWLRGRRRVARRAHGRRDAHRDRAPLPRRFAEGDLFARLGTTEFALATPNALDGRQLGLLAQRLRDQLNDAALPPLADTPIGASIGIAFFPEDADDSAGVMAAANAAMYAARRAGKNHVAFNALAA